MKLSESVLLYNFSDKEIEKKIKAILIQMGIKIKKADHSHLNETVGYLLGIKGVEPSNQSYDGEPMPGQLLVMKGFTGDRLDHFLMQMRRSGIPRIPYKAVITQSNQNWPLKRLYKEIVREHEELAPRQKSPESDS